MRYVLDASVAIAALRTTEPCHAASLRRCLPFFAGSDDIVVPAIFDVEVFSALVRRGAEPARVNELFEAHFGTRTLLPIGPRIVRAVRGVVAATRLRAADAFYVWAAAREGVPLVTLDDEVIGRAHLAGATATRP